MLNGLGFQLSATSETRAGEAPIVPEEAPRLFVAEVITPLVGLELRRPNFTFQLFYGLRIFWEDPSPITTVQSRLLSPDPVTLIRGEARTPISKSGPLYLNSAGFTLDGHPTRAVTAVVSASGSIGSPDYTALPQVLGTVQGTLPPILSLESGTGQARVRFQATRRWELALGAQVFHSQWLDVPESASTSTGTTPASPGTQTVIGQPLVTGQTFVSADPGTTFVLTGRDSIGLDTTLGEASYSDGVSFWIVTPAVTWKRRLTARDNLRLTLGFAYAHSLATPVGIIDPLGASGSGGAPIGSVELTSRVTRLDNVAVLSHLTGGVDLYVDPILGTALPRASVGAGVTAISIPHWMITLHGDFATALKTPPSVPDVVGQGVVAPLVGSPVTTLPDETVFSIALSGRRRVAESLFAEIGGLWADRGPVLTTPDFRFHQRQLWIHFSLTATTRPIPRDAQLPQP